MVMGIQWDIQRCSLTHLGWGKVAEMLQEKRKGLSSMAEGECMGFASKGEDGRDVNWAPCSAETTGASDMLVSHISSVAAGKKWLSCIPVLQHVSAPCVCMEQLQTAQPVALPAGIFSLPCRLEPCKGGSKKGVCMNEHEFRLTVHQPFVCALGQHA